MFNTHALSEVARSNLFTMQASKQYLPDAPYLIPPPEVRLLRANLILEEALETVAGLGFSVTIGLDGQVQFCEDKVPDLEKIIDGACDTDYVAIGALLACGVHDLVHIREVCRANDAKFPGGVGVPHPTIPNKFGKPEGWQPPNHQKIIDEVAKSRLKG